jgi:hypothetical protein
MVLAMTLGLLIFGDEAERNYHPLLMMTPPGRQGDEGLSCKPGDLGVSLLYHISLSHNRSKS